MSKENKVSFGLKGAHYAVITEEEGVITYGTPIPMPGSVELSLEPNGDPAEMWADDGLYYSEDNNQGYNGTLNIAMIPQTFAIDCLGEVLDETTGTIAEVAEAKKKKFALLFEFSGDVKAVRHVIYQCIASRPTISSSTKTTSKEPTTTELAFKASPTPFDEKLYVKNKTIPSDPSTTYDNWYKNVFVPGTTPGGA